MPENTGSYECEFCGKVFDSGPKKAGHISGHHQSDRNADDLVDELNRLATKLGRSPTMPEMNTEGRYSLSTYLSEFETWNNALQAAGLKVNIPSDISKEEIVEAIQSLGMQLGHPPTVNEMNEQGRYSRKTASKYFGSWNNALRKAGFEPNHEVISREELLEEIHRLAKRLGRPPVVSDLQEEGRFSIRGYLREFGGWDTAITTAGYEPHTPFSGSDHPNWVGASKRERLWYGSNWNKRRQSALERDSHECQHPGCQLSSDTHRDDFYGSLHVHHIIPLRSFQNDNGVIDYEQAHTLNNLVTLCVEHHAQWEEISPLRPDIR